MAKSSFFEKFNNKSKYFQFIEKDVIYSQVISYNGTIIPLPKDWALKKVQVTFHDGEKQEMYVKDNGNICYITCAKIYLGTNVKVNLLPNEKNNNNSSLFSNTINKLAIGAIYLTLAIYAIAIIPF